MNYQFDLKKWMGMFPLEERNGRYYGNTITGPRDICNIEWLRREMKNEYHWGKPVPSDLFIMADGEPDNRYATKIGGLPYRPAAIPWPRSKKGQPMEFIAQFNFSDSKDIAGGQLGDLLLIFAERERKRFEEFHLEWQSITKQTALVTETPEFKNPISPCYGYRCRVNNYPGASRKSRRTEYPQCLGKDVWSDHFLLQYQGTQIGKSAFEPQGSYFWRSLLCSIASVQPRPHGTYPWVNWETSLSAEEDWSYSSDHLMVGDLGCLFVRRNWLGKITVDNQSY